jgi:hypothetical protein
MKKNEPSRPAMTLSSKTIRALSALDLAHAAGGLGPVPQPRSVAEHAPEPHPW